MYTYRLTQPGQVIPDQHVGKHRFSEIGPHPRFVERRPGDIGKTPVGRKTVDKPLFIGTQAGLNQLLPFVIREHGHVLCRQGCQKGITQRLSLLLAVT